VTDDDVVELSADGTFDTSVTSKLPVPPEITPAAKVTEIQSESNNTEDPTLVDNSEEKEDNTPPRKFSE